MWHEAQVLWLEISDFDLRITCTPCVCASVPHTYCSYLTLFLSFCLSFSVSHCSCSSSVAIASDICPLTVCCCCWRLIDNIRLIKYWTGTTLEHTLIHRHTHSHTNTHLCLFWVQHFCMQIPQKRHKSVIGQLIYNKLMASVRPLLLDEMRLK